MTSPNAQLAASIELCRAIRIRCYALVGVRSLNREDRLHEETSIRHSITALIRPLPQSALGPLKVQAAKALGSVNGPELIQSLWAYANLSEEEAFHGL